MCSVTVIAEGYKKQEDLVNDPGFYRHQLGRVEIYDPPHRQGMRMRRKLSMVLVSAVSLMVVTYPNPARSTDTNTTTASDSTKTSTEAYIGGGLGKQRLDGNDYLSSLFSRYTNEQVVVGSTRLYFVAGIVSRFGVFEAQVSAFYNSFAPKLASDNAGTIN